MSPAKPVLLLAAMVSLAACSGDMDGMHGDRNMQPGRYSAMNGSAMNGSAMNGMAMGDTQNFAMMAASSDQFEIQSSKLALMRSRTPMVRRIAQRMIADHMKSSRQMMAIARADGMSMPSRQLDGMQQDMLDQLKNTPRADFDNAYLQAQDMAHQKAIALFQDYAQNGDNPDLRMFAQQTLPVLQQHDEMVQQAEGM